MIVKEIEDGRFVKWGDMKCKGCKRDIKDEYYLVANHYISKRGNEDDYAELFCIDCSSKEGAWKKWFSDINKQLHLDIANTRILKRKALEMIRKALDIEIEEEEDCTHIIIRKEEKEEEEKSFVIIKGYDKDYPLLKTTLRRAFTGASPQVGDTYLGWLVVEEIEEVTFEEFFK